MIFLGTFKMKIYKYKNYKQYGKIQEKANIKKLHKVGVIESNIKMISWIQLWKTLCVFSNIKII